jgi:outer membrane lipoprotein LolB
MRMAGWHVWALTFAMASNLGACASWQPPPVADTMPVSDAVSIAQQVRYAGHLNLKLQAFGDKGAEGGSFHFDLQAQPTSGVMDISTPFGTLVASVRWNAGNASLLTPNGQQVFASIDELLTQALGEPLPVATLLYWLKGQPDPNVPFTWLNAPSSPTAMAQFQQLDWWVDATDLAAGVLHAHRDTQPQVRGAKLTIRLDQ